MAGIAEGEDGAGDVGSSQSCFEQIGFFVLKDQPHGFGGGRIGGLFQGEFEEGVILVFDLEIADDLDELRGAAHLLEGWLAAHATAAEEQA